MKNILLLLITIVLLSFSVVSEVKAQSTIRVRATAEVIEALATRETSQLSFGRFSPEAQGGKIIMSPNGVRTAEGSVVLAGGTSSSAGFIITGQLEATFSITLPTTPEILTNLENAKTMTVGEWKSSLATGEAVGKMTEGGLTLSVGASLFVGDMNANPAGIYTGSYAVTVVYN